MNCSDLVCDGGFSALLDSWPPMFGFLSVRVSFPPLYLVIYMHGVPQDCDRTCITVTSLHSPTPFLRLSHKEKNKSCGLNLKLLRRSCLHIVIPTYQSHISEFIWDILFFLCSSIIVIKRNQDTGVDSNPTFGGYTHLTVFLLPILSVLSDTD